MMNPKAQQIHAANRERMLRERAAMLARFGGGVVVGKTFRAAGMSERFCRAVADIAKPETRERNCLRCERPFKSEGIGHRMCWDCSRLPEGFGL